jgi:Ca-activated chloride channel homolog
VEASVLDRQGEFAGGLAQKDFRVLDNGVEQPIVFFAPVEAPAQIVVMIETSPAVYLIHSQHLTAAYALLDGLAPDDRVALVTYSDVPRAALNFTADKGALIGALNGMQYTIGMGQLNFYDSVSQVLDWLPAGTSKTALVLLTTGLDSSSPARWDALVQKLRGRDAVIFSVALGGSLRGRNTKKPKGKKHAAGAGLEGSDASAETGFARADETLTALATMTGGRVYFPETEQDFVPAYREIAAALRHQYVLGIAPSHDGQYHALTVEVRENAGAPPNAAAKRGPYRILVRQGYLAPAQ